MPSEQTQSPRSYKTWMGIEVFLKITTGETKTSLPCTIIGESDTTVRVRIADQWDVEIYKEMILVVDAYPTKDTDLAHPCCEGLVHPSADGACD